MTPTGISAGASRVRAAVSAASRNMPPTSAEAGSRSRWSGPIIIRTACGITIPTKPIKPLTDTTAPESRAEVKNTVFLTLSTSTPKDRADSSPSVRMLRALVCMNRIRPPTKR